MGERWLIYKCPCRHCVGRPWKSTPRAGSGYRAFETYEEAVNYFIARTTKNGGAS